MRMRVDHTASRRLHAVAVHVGAARRARRSRRAPSPGTGRRASARSRSTARPAGSPSSPLVGERADHALDVLDDRRLDAFGRLVEDQQLRLRRQRAADRELLLLAARQVAAAPVRASASAPGTARTDRAGIARAARLRGEAHAQVLLDRQAREDLAALRHVADAARARARRACARVMSRAVEARSLPRARPAPAPIRLFSSVVLPTPLRPSSDGHLARAAPRRSTSRRMWLPP